MSQITHFCGVKLIAWKSGCVKFWTNIMSGKYLSCRCFDWSYHIEISTGCPKKNALSDFFVFQHWTTLMSHLYLMQIVGPFVYSKFKVKTFMLPGNTGCPKTNALSELPFWETRYNSTWPFASGRPRTVVPSVSNQQFRKCVFFWTSCTYL